MRALIVLILAIATSLTSDVIVPGRVQLDRKIAAEFAPVFYQGLGEYPRADYITNFDFDGDWKGDNNWKNLDDTSLTLRAWVYYSVVETTTHYFVHYAVFHPRDYKGGLAASQALSTAIQIGLERLGRDPTGGLADDVALSHENDFEGCLLVAAKQGTEPSDASVEYIETMAHNRYLRYRTSSSRSGIGEMIDLEGNHPLIFIEPRGHGMLKYPGPRQVESIKYIFAGRADVSDKVERAEAVGYDIVPLLDSFWKRAVAGKGDTFATESNYPSFAIRSEQSASRAVEVKIPARKLGATLKGSVGFANKARMPWGWYDQTEKDRPAGEWFFDPASVIARHFDLESSFSRVYVYHPYLK
jgi:hypothetical protein